ncbi:right-handed parallel beta-helix repeat-containing protein [Neobacillus dielmonensis]|uniref:right-handed parallel beta-helix repeat-containing protein n=1 Tax=Neobacillus dielmonensis TaxID=1347369 RepID=UPI000A9C1004|nr:pectate lyase [Neobacillus dielmonensis]
MKKIGSLFLIGCMLISMFMPKAIYADDEITLNVKDGQIGFDSNIALQNSNIAKVTNVSGHTWTEEDGALQSPNNGKYWTDTNNLNGNAPGLTYKINFDTPGTYNVWVLAQAPDTSSDSIHLGLDGGWKVWKGLKGTSNFTWNQLGPLVVDKAGLHDLNLWVREDGFAIKQIYLTTGSQNPSDYTNWITSPGSDTPTVPTGPTSYYISPTGSDTNPGTKEAPFKSMKKAQEAASSGDTVYIRGGVYDEFEIAKNDSNYNYVNDIYKSGITYEAYPGERPVFDFKNVPTNLRVAAFFVEDGVTGIKFKGFDVTGVKVGNQKQSEAFRIRGQADFENMAAHDNEAIGFYYTGHGTGTVLNTDSYNNIGPTDVSASNTDGFGAHGEAVSFINSRAWNNSDDGFDSISSQGPVIYDHDWSFNNRGNQNGIGDQNGFKVGGYAYRTTGIPDPLPLHTVQYCLAANNGANGFYANHMPGQSANWTNNTAYNNGLSYGANFNMLERVSPTDINNIPGYREVLHNNISYKGTLIENIDNAQTPAENMTNNSWNINGGLNIKDQDFESLDITQLSAPRKEDGSLPDVSFMRPVTSSQPYKEGLGYLADQLNKESKIWRFDFGSAKNVANGYTGVPSNLAYTADRGYGFLGLGPDGYKEDNRSDGFVMQEGQEIKLQDVSKPNPKTADEDAVAVTDPDMPIRFAVNVTPNTYYKVKVTLTGADQSKDAKVNLFSEKRHFLLTEKVIPAGTSLTYEFNVNVQDVYSKVTGTYVDTMLNIAVSGENAAISSAKIMQMKQGKTLWVLGDSTVNDQLAPLPYFRLQNYSGVGQALSKYIGQDIAVSNHAESGLNNYSSIKHFNQFKDRIKPGDFIYFEFGHNHKTDGPTGYYNGISYYYDYVHSKGANFIIVGPVDRHNAYQYNAAANTWSSTLDGFSTIGKQYVEEKVAAGATDIAFVDLNAPTLSWYSQLCEALGKTAKSTDYYFRGMQGEKVDGTHPNDAGADNFAKLFFDGVKAIVNDHPETPQAKVLAGLLEGVRDELPYTVPDSITSLGPAPNSAYPKPYVPGVTHKYPLAIENVVLDANGKIVSMTVTKQGDLSTYGRGIVEIHKANGELKGTAYANEQIDNTIEGTQTVTFTTDLTVDVQQKETLKAYVMGFEDKPGYPLTDEQLSEFYTR